MSNYAEECKAELRRLAELANTDSILERNIASYIRDTIESVDFEVKYAAEKGFE